MPKPHPRQFRDDAIAMARRGEEPISVIAKNLGVAEATLHRWLRIAETQDAAAGNATTGTAATGGGPAGPGGDDESYGVPMTRYVAPIINNSRPR